MKYAFEPGRLVCSLAGRDAGKYYLVIGWEDERRVLVVDGKWRKMSCPKKKNIKHLKAYPQLAEAIAAKLTAGRRISDEEIRNALSELTAGQNGKEVGEESCPKTM